MSTVGVGTREEGRGGPRRGWGGAELSIKQIIIINNYEPQNMLKCSVPVRIKNKIIFVYDRK